MVVSSTACFSAAVERIIRTQPHGYKAVFAGKLGISPQYLSDLLKGRKHWPDDQKDKAAHALGMSVAELLQIGQVVVETGLFFPYVRNVSVMPTNSEARAEWIMQRAGRDAGLGVVRFLSVAAVKVWAWGVLEPYLAGKEGDADLYTAAMMVCRQIKGVDNGNS